MIVHGVAEHGGRYDHISRWLLQRGVRVIVPDLRGHGRSGGIRTDVRSFQDYVQDLIVLRKELSIDPQKMLLMGHSMGGLIACRYAETEPRGLGALALSCPLLKMSQRIHPLVYAMGVACWYLAPTTRFKTKFRHEEMARDTRFVRCRSLDPFLQRSLTARWYFAAQQALRQVYQDVRQIRVPVKILQGADDRVVDPQGAIDFHAALMGPFHEVGFLPGHLHEILNEVDWETVTKSYFDWAVHELFRKSERNHMRPTA